VIALLTTGHLDAEDRNGTPVLSEVANLVPLTDLVEDDVRFGTVISMDGNTMVVGAPEEDALAAYSGAAYLFVKVDGVWNIQAKLLASDGDVGDRFGISVGLSDDTLVVGASMADAPTYQSGAAYVFRRIGSRWSQAAKLVASDGSSSDHFGCSVAVDGHSIVVGASGEDTLGTTAGAAYVFIESGGIWSEQQKLTAGDGGPQDRFGTSVALDGETVLVGAPTHSGHGSFAGGAYVFTRSGGSWSEQQELLPAGLSPDDYFGWSVALEGDNAVAGAIFDDDEGAAYVFVRSGAVWSQQQRLSDTGGMPDDEFGWSVAISGNTVVVGSFYDDHVGGADAGSTFVFIRVGTVWSQQQKLGEAVAATGDFFGYSVAVTGDDLVAGVPLADHDGGTDSGSAVPYERTGGSWTALSTVRALASFAGMGTTYSGQSSASISDGVLVVGTHKDDISGMVWAGAAYVFLGSGSIWGQHARLIEPVPATSNEFGRSVATTGDTIVVGAPGDAHSGGTDVGSTYVFARSGAVWDLQAQLRAADAGDNDGFGTAVAISADTIVVGAPYEDGLGSNRGAAYVFVRSGTTWSQQQKLVASDAADGDGFGYRVAVSGDILLVAAPDDDHGGLTSAGSAYVFVRSGTTWGEEAKLVAPDADTNSWFSEGGVAVDGTTAVIGTPRASPSGISRAGSVYVFVESGASWSLQQTLVLGDPSGSDLFGGAVDLDGDLLVIGDPHRSRPGGYAEGSTFIFSRSGTSWSLMQELTPENSSYSDYFGSAVATVQGTVAARAPGYDFPTQDDTGAVYVFEPDASDPIFSDDFESGDTLAWSEVVP